MTWAVLLIAVVLLAYSNGANDNFKGVATLFGTGTAGYRGALALATVCTFLGSLVALWIGAELLHTFSGKGLVPTAVIADPSFLPAVSLGAAGTVLLATFAGIPVSTTHALTGSLVGAGLIAASGQVHLATLGKSFFLPLMLSPVLALVTTSLAYQFIRPAGSLWSRVRNACAFARSEAGFLAVDESGAAAAASLSGGLGGRTIPVDAPAQTAEPATEVAVGSNAPTVLNRCHYISAGAVSFARGLNDTPKIAALLLGAQALPPSLGIALVAVAIAIGGLLNARKVAVTMSHRITAMNHGEGLSANLVTALLVIGASRLGVPVSTTHVSCGALFGLGAVSGAARWKTIGGILMAWVATLPVAAALGTLAILFIVP